MDSRAPKNSLLRFVRPIANGWTEWRPRCHIANEESRDKHHGYEPSTDPSNGAMWNCALGCDELGHPKGQRRHGGKRVHLYDRRHVEQRLESHAWLSRQAATAIVLKRLFSTSAAEGDNPPPRNTYAITPPARPARNDTRRRRDRASSCRARSRIFFAAPQARAQEDAARRAVLSRHAEPLSCRF